jgi:hypothetical protein
MPYDPLDLHDPYRYEQYEDFSLFALPGFYMFSNGDKRLKSGQDFIAPECAAWCFDRFGPVGKVIIQSDRGAEVKWEGFRWATSPGGGIYVFDPNDALEFRLRWC